MARPPESPATARGLARSRTCSKPKSGASSKAEISDSCTSKYDAQIGEFRQGGEGKWLGNNKLDFSEKVELLFTDTLIVVLQELQDMIVANVWNDLAGIESIKDVFDFRIRSALEEIDPGGRVEGNVFRSNRGWSGASH